MAFGINNRWDEPSKTGKLPPPCPLRYDRISVQEIGEGKARPYLFGERQRPRCKNCDSREEWASICQFKAGQASV